jgi:transcriptional regulator with XRE-family HTH domain
MRSTKKVACVQKNWHFLDMMSSEQCRAARAWLNWTQQELARRAHVGLSTVKEFEKGERRTIAATAEAMQRALADAGIEFLDEGGEAVGIRRKPLADAG